MGLKIFLLSQFFFHFCILPLSAQEPEYTSEDNSYYFDDGGISEAKNLFKINLVPIFSGDFPFYYERLFGDSFSIEAGVGVLLPFYNPDLGRLWLEEDPDIEDPDWGSSWRVGMRYYLMHTAPENGYFGVQYNRRNYRLNDEKVAFKDISFGFGYQSNPSGRLIIDFSTGVGFRFKETKNASAEEEEVDLVLPIALKIGVLI